MGLIWSKTWFPILPLAIALSITPPSTVSAFPTGGDETKEPRKSAGGYEFTRLATVYNTEGGLLACGTKHNDLLELFVLLSPTFYDSSKVLRERDLIEREPRARGSGHSQG